MINDFYGNPIFDDWTNDCPHKGSCTDYPMRCGSCGCNPRKSFYRPKTYEPCWIYTSRTTSPRVMLRCR